MSAHCQANTVLVRVAVQAVWCESVSARILAHYGLLIPDSTPSAPLISGILQCFLALEVNFTTYRTGSYQASNWMQTGAEQLDCRHSSGSFHAPAMPNIARPGPVLSWPPNCVADPADLLTLIPLELSLVIAGNDCSKVAAKLRNTGGDH